MAAARKLFTEAVKDEESGAFDVALAKFQKVQGVRDTAAVRFRIGACLEGLGRLREAQKAYASALEAAATDAGQRELAGMAHDKRESVVRRTPTLTLSLSPRAPSDAVVTVDDQPVGAEQLGKAMALDPGPHRIAGKGTGAQPFATEVTLPEGGRVDLIVALDAAAAPPPPPPPPPPVEAQPRWLGWALVGGGAALVAVGGVSFALRESAIGSIKDDCPGGRCPASRRTAVEGATDRAKVLLPVGIVSGVVGLGAAGVGTFLLLRPRGSGGSPSGPAVAPNGDGVTLLYRGSFQ